VVHVYWALPDAWAPEALASAWTVLDSDEEARARRFHFERDRLTFLVAHALLRQALAWHAHVEPRAWRFVAQAHGRPEIGEPQESPRLRFSLSHTHGLAACAITFDADIGLDVENVHRRAPLGIAPEIFAPEELTRLRAEPQAEQGEEFFVYWTLKESYAKARGLGLILPFRQIAFQASTGAPIRVSLGPRCADDPAHWRFRSWRIADRYQAALALRTETEFGLQVSEVKSMTAAKPSCGQ
jgi:4'-phosphopantetheinyl transferase